MKKIAIYILSLLLGTSEMCGQVQRSDEFHDKYKLTGVAVFSRHNIRAPQAEPGSFISQVTPYEWHDFGVGRSELTMKGGILETTVGQFFHQWVVSEGLFPENAEPTDEEIYVLANSKQRTISTARHFISSFMPMKTITVNHEGKVGNMDPNFSLNLGTDITDSEWAQIKAEYDAAYGEEKLRQACQDMQPVFSLVEDVIDAKDSEAYQSGEFTGFNDYNSVINFAAGTEPDVTASLKSVVSVVDALVLQYYEEPDETKAAFGKTLTSEQWHQLAGFIAMRDGVRFSSPFVQRYVSRHQRQLLAEALQMDDRKFTFLCGHDTNILNILRAMRTRSYDVTDAIENEIPIGSKIVFEKWTDNEGNDFIGVNHVYQSVDQLRGNILLNLATPPCIHPLEFEGLEANADGLYTLKDMTDLLTDNNLPSAVNAPAVTSSSRQSMTYTISGTPANGGYRGIAIRNNEKTLVK